ncbi:MAG: hypothetical protein KY443_04825 [Actinobacteria bacterium]|nr:hypothetical protein [Actinomycetota bacterium]
MKRVMACAVALLSVTGAACGDSGSGDSADPTPTTAAGSARPAPTEAEARAALLTSADFPSGWQADESGDDNPSNARCQEFEALNDHKPAADAEASFAAARTGPFVEHRVLAFADVAAAERHMTLIEEAVRACASFGGNGGTGSFSLSDGPDLGDESLAASIRARATGLELDGEIVAVRRGRAVSLLTQIAMQIANIGGAELRSSLTEELAGKAAAKLQAAA